jgi:hypothetical protein
MAHDLLLVVHVAAGSVAWLSDPDGNTFAIEEEMTP